MSQEGVTARVELRRNDSSVPWGFRMHGGREYGKPLFIQKVTKNSLAHKAGLEPGDVIVMIGKTNASVYSHQEAKMEIVRSGCDLDFIVQKRKMELPQVNSVPVPQKNSTISEESIHWEGTGAENKQLQSRSFRMLQMHLDESEATGERPPSQLDAQRAAREAEEQAHEMQPVSSQQKPEAPPPAPAPKKEELPQVPKVKTAPSEAAPAKDADNKAPAKFAENNKVADNKAKTAQNNKTAAKTTPAAKTPVKK